MRVSLLLGLCFGFSGVFGQPVNDSILEFRNDTVLILPVNNGQLSGVLLSPQFAFSGKGSQWGGELFFMSGICGFGCAALGLGGGFHQNWNGLKKRYSGSVVFANSLFYVGSDFKLQGNFHLMEDHKSFSLQPGIGLAIFHIYFHYGYDFHFSDPEKEFIRHSLSIQTYLPCFPLFN